MARITVEDCLAKIDSQYDLVLLAKERTAQLNAGNAPLVEKENDKNTVIALREIGDGKISLKNLEDTAINKLRKVQERSEVSEDADEDEVENDSFDKTYKGEVSKSGTAILPSKRVRRIPEKLIFQNKTTEISEAFQNKEAPKSTDIIDTTETETETETDQSSLSTDKKPE